jgi:HIV-1 Vpr-binding protein
MDVLLAADTPPVLRAAAARCLCAVLASSRHAQFPVTEEALYTRLLQWSDGRGFAAPNLPHGSALRAYAMGLLAIALTLDDVAAFAVREGVMTPLMRGLRATILGDGASGGGSGSEVPAAPESTEETAEDAGALAMRLHVERVRATAAIADYLDCFGAALAEGALEVTLRMLTQHGGADGGGATPRFGAWASLDSSAAAQLGDALNLTCALLAHRRFAMLFVSSGGLALLLALPAAHPAVAPGVSRALYNIACATPALESTAAMPGMPRDLVAHLLLLLESGQEAARRHALLMLALALPLRAFLAAFDDAGGLRPLLNLLRSAASLRAGQSSAAKGAACLACHALRQYLRTHCTFHAERLRAALAAAAAATAAAGATPGGKPTRGERPSRGQRADAADVSNAAAERLVAALRGEKRLGAAFLRAVWLPLEAVLAQGGMSVLLELVFAALSGDRHLSDSLQDALVRGCTHASA